MTFTLASLFSAFSLLLFLFTSSAYGAAASCDATVVNFIKANFNQPAYFCTWWQSSPRTDSPFSSFDATALSQACQCIINASPKQTLQSTPSAPTTSACTPSGFSFLYTEYKDPKAFCSFYNKIPRANSPIAGKGIQDVRHACKCLLTSTPSSTSFSSSSSSSSSPSSGSCTYVTGPTAHSFCSSFLRSTTFIVSTASSTSTVSLSAQSTAVSTKTITNLVTVTANAQNTLATVTKVNGYTAVTTAYTVDYTNTVNIGTKEISVQKRSVAPSASSLPSPPSWAGFGSWKLSSACSCVLPSATFALVTSYKSTTTQVFTTTVNQAVVTATSTVTVTRDSTIVTSNTLTSYVTAATSVANATTTVTNTLQSVLTVSSNTPVNINGAFCTSYLNYVPPTTTTTSTSTVAPFTVSTPFTVFETATATIALSTVTSYAFTSSLVSNNSSVTPNKFRRSPVDANGLYDGGVSSACSNVATGTITFTAVTTTQADTATITTTSTVTTIAATVSITTTTSVTVSFPEPTDVVYIAVKGYTQGAYLSLNDAITLTTDLSQVQSFYITADHNLVLTDSTGVLRSADQNPGQTLASLHMDTASAIASDGYVVVNAYEKSDGQIKFRNKDSGAGITQVCVESGYPYLYLGTELGSGCTPVKLYMYFAPP